MMGEKQRGTSFHPNSWFYDHGAGDQLVIASTWED